MGSLRSGHVIELELAMGHVSRAELSHKDLKKITPRIVNLGCLWPFRNFFGHIITEYSNHMKARAIKDLH